jgi:hypothetical protein
MIRLLTACAQWGGLCSSVVFMLIVCGQIRAYGYRNWKRFGLGTGTDANRDIEELAREEEKRDEREERLLRCIEALEFTIEHNMHP